MAIVYLGLGSNLGDRKQYLLKAIEQLNDNGFTIDAIAPLYTTRAMGFDGQEFYNTVVRADTDHDTYDLLTAIEEIEKALGKVQREKPKKNEEIVYHDRVIDIDVLLYDDMISHTSDITIPHRSIAQRDFFLQPLIHLDSELRCPMTDALYAEMLAAIPEEEKTILDIIHDWHE